MDIVLLIAIFVWVTFPFVVWYVMRVRKKTKERVGIFGLPSFADFDYMKGRRLIELEWQERLRKWQSVESNPDSKKS